MSIIITDPIALAKQKELQEKRENRTNEYEKNKQLLDNGTPIEQILNVKEFDKKADDFSKQSSQSQENAHKLILKINVLKKYPFMTKEEREKLMTDEEKAIVNS